MRLSKKWLCHSLPGLELENWKKTRQSKKTTPEADLEIRLWLWEIRKQVQKLGSQLTNGAEEILKTKK